MITRRQYIITYYYLIRALFFGTATSLLVSVTGNACYLSAIIGIGLGLIFSLILYYINKVKKEKKIVDFLDKGWCSLLGKIILFLIGVVLLNDVLVSISTMAYAFYLVSTPVIYITIALALVIFYAIKKGVKGFIRAIEILFPLSIAIFLIKSTTFFGMVHLENFKPWLNSDTFSIFNGAMIYFANTITPGILMLNFSNSDYEYKDNVKGLLLGSGTILIILVLIIGIYGMPMAKMLRYPEYMILKKVNILNFIENIENFLTIVLIIDNIVVGVLATFLVRDVVKDFIKSDTFIKWWDGLFLAIMCVICVKVFNNHYPNIMLLYKYEYILMLGLVLSLLGLILWHIKRLDK